MVHRLLIWIFFVAFREMSPSSGALVVHNEVDEPAVVNFHALGILAAYINSSPDIGEKAGDPSCMAGKLCYLAVCERDVEPSIACGYDIGDVINLQAGLLQCLSHNLVGKLAMLRPGWALDGRK